MNINISQIKIPYDKLLARLGYLKLHTKIDKKTEILIKENLGAAQKLIQPKAVLAFENISTAENIISFENGFKIQSAGVAKLFQNCFKAYGIAVTIGATIENRRNDYLTEKETFKALIFDAAGSVAAEEAVSAAYEQIKKIEAENNNIVTKRYSPGYGDWAIESQKDFLEWLGASHIGISLNKAFLMRPEKSVSAIIGVKAYP